MPRFLFKIRELVNCLAQGRSDEEKATFVQPFEEALTTAGGQKPFEQDEERRRKVLALLLPEVNSIGSGSERGASQPSFLPDQLSFMDALCRG